MSTIFPMTSLSELPLDALFPTKGAITPALQIGRGEAIVDVTERVVDGDDLLVIEPRRVGKSSALGRGAAEHIHSEYGGVVAQADLRLSGLTTADALAGKLLETALASGGGTPLTQQQVGRLAKRTGRFAQSKRVQAAGKLVGQENKIGNLQALATLLIPESSDLDQLEKVLSALEEDAQDQQRPVVVFIDEVQDLGSDRWVGDDGLKVQRLLERSMRQPDRLTTFIYAGSEQTAMSQLFAEGKPLHLEGQRYRLPEISIDAWHSGVASRFAIDGREITQERVDVILDATSGQPLRTMQVCREALRTARRQGAEKIGDAIVADAVAQAREHPSWHEAD